MGLSNCLPFAYEMMFTPATDIMDKWFETEPLKATILTDACIGSVLSPNTIGSRYNMHNIVILNLNTRMTAALPRQLRINSSRHGRY